MEGIERDRGVPALSLGDRGWLAAEVWLRFAWAVVALRRRPLPEVVARLSVAHAQRASARDLPAPMRLPPQRLGRAVDRVLHVGPWRARCLPAAVALLAMLARRGHEADLVIGLPILPRDKDAHAWVEVGSRDVGPPPGRMGLEPLVRYRASA